MAASTCEPGTDLRELGTELEEPGTDAQELGIEHG